MESTCPQSFIVNVNTDKSDLPRYKGVTFAIDKERGKERYCAKFGTNWYFDRYIHGTMVAMVCQI